MSWLLSDLNLLPVTEQVSARIEAARTALAAAAGVGATVTLMLAVRRQRHQELAAAHSAHDAAERRVTELYTKAAEQLGNTQAPVRLAGLYALERLAHDTPALRQTIVDVICAYLRMPYTPPRDDLREKIRTAQRAARARTGSSNSAAGRSPWEEQQVRLTAQRILTEHLRHTEPSSSQGRWYRRPWRRKTPTSSRFWDGIRLDLTGATLINFDFQSCHPAHAYFVGATFCDNAVFDGAIFPGCAEFGDATFGGITRFNNVTFQDNAWFVGATFDGGAWFNGTTFDAAAEFREAVFKGPVRFGRATFDGAAQFDRAIFDVSARFGGAAFHDDVGFRQVLGAERVSLAGAVTTSDGKFRKRHWPPGWHPNQELAPNNKLGKVPVVQVTEITTT
ncbi:pentapeptide repeat-containing protein [Nonomuraea gerenzanensis]|uniref:pentapeptide repeat-containing protein n=1 Tax=Nonomuraea gerenzanensis TaxID=93944 RepID=UPI001CDA5195|nr:pentapeptide repeat-containing protein [Nonomuraea gerenzanensis]UBU18092.1 pentapeptide repeat-containing protein [Nonomuraea gerenzanensis]